MYIAKYAGYERRNINLINRKVSDPMPTYGYVCRSCGYQFEEFQSMKDAPLSVCPKCRKDSLHRKIGAGAGVIFKGSGFYCTDYKAGNASDGAHDHTNCSCHNHSK